MSETAREELEGYLATRLSTIELLSVRRMIDELVAEPSCAYCGHKEFECQNCAGEFPPKE